MNEIRTESSGVISRMSSMLTQTFYEWMEDNVPLHGAALAFYTALSLAPLIVIALRVSSFFFSDESARAEIERQMSSLLGTSGEAAIQGILKNANEPQSGTLAMILSSITLILGGAGVFGQLQESLNTIWNVVPKQGRGFFEIIRDRFVSMAMVMGTAFLLLVSLIASAILSFLGSYSFTVPGDYPILLEIVNLLVSLAVITFLFALMFKLLPDAVISWSDVWPGALLTAIFFTAGKFVIGMYLGQSALASSYGAAGSLIVLLVWVYYSAQIVFLGAEFTQVYMKRCGKPIIATDNAVKKSESTGL